MNDKPGRLAAAELAMDSAHIPLIQAIIDKHFVHYNSKVEALRKALFEEQKRNVILTSVLDKIIKPHL